MREILAQLQTIREEIDNLTRMMLEAWDTQKPPEAPEGQEAAPDFYSVQDLAEMFQVSPATIYRWGREGRFPKGVQWGPRTRRWSKAEVEELGINGGHQG